MISYDNSFRLRPGGLDCNKGGLTLAGNALLKREVSLTGRETWAPVSVAEVERALMAAYGAAPGAAEKINGLKVVAAALNSGDLARAQTASLFLHLPDPSDITKHLIYFSRTNIGKDWDPEKHPRLGGAPNAGWFAPKDGDDSSAGEGDRSRGATSGHRGPNPHPDGAQNTDQSNQEMAFAEPYDLVAAQNLGGMTICIYHGRFLGGMHQELEYSGICKPTIWMKGQ